MHDYSTVHVLIRVHVQVVTETQNQNIKVKDDGMNMPFTKELMYKENLKITSIFHDIQSRDTLKTVLDSLLFIVTYWLILHRSTELLLAIRSWLLFILKTVGPLSVTNVMYLPVIRASQQQQRRSLHLMIPLKIFLIVIAKNMQEGFMLGCL